MADNLARPVGPRLAVFASDRGPGDPERASIMSQAGRYFALHGAGVVCLAEDDVLPVALATAARGAQGEVTIIADESSNIPVALADVPLRRNADPAARRALMAELSDVFVGLPGSLASASSLFATWTSAFEKGVSRPIVLVNRNRAYEFVRGLAADVLSHSVRDQDRVLQFADSVEDAWNKAQWLLSQR